MKSKHEVGNSRVYMMDCMEFMKDLPDGYFDLCVCDPPYGIGMDGNNNWSGSKHEVKDWDNDAPSTEYFNELMRISKNQIVWGANHFISRMPFDSKCWLIWDKKNDGFSFADGELAWTSFNTAVRFFRYHRGQQTNKRIHPTQKPIKLYDWIFKNYLPDGGKVFDSHLGSGSSRIAADKAGNIDFTGTEIDEDYFKASVDRFNKYKSQLTLF